jgi:hypothetical protein
MKFGLVISLFFGVSALADITAPPSGDNQRSTVIQHIGPVTVSVDYSSPRVTLHGDDRRGKIWGTLVPYGMSNLGKTCPQCPWRAGANENTVFTTSHNIQVQGQALPAGRYGVHMIPGPDEWTVIFSKNSSSWGSFSYDPKEDALRVQTKSAKNDYHEWLTYEFTEREPTKATLALEWEDLKVPISISVENAPALYSAAMLDELRGSTGFDWHNVEQVALYLLDNKLDPAQALKLAQRACDADDGGEENVSTLMTLARAQAANSQDAESKKTLERALNFPSAKPLDLHLAGRELLKGGDKEDAMKFFKTNAKRFPNQWPVHVGLMRGYSALGDNKKALEECKLALKQVPDEQNRKNLERLAKALEEGRKVD